MQNPIIGLVMQGFERTLLSHLMHIYTPGHRGVAVGHRLWASALVCMGLRRKELEQMPRGETALLCVPSLVGCSAWSLPGMCIISGMGGNSMVDPGHSLALMGEERGAGWGYFACEL